MSAGMPELGSKISLISKADIRYEGRLFTVDPKECTIALSSVRSFGTEDRETPYPVPAQNQVYDYILFRGSDIKDIRVVNNVTQPLNDPAIMQLSVPPSSIGQQSFQSHPMLGHMGGGGGPPQMGQFAAGGYGGPMGAMGPAGLSGGLIGTNMGRGGVELIMPPPSGGGAVGGQTEQSLAAVLSPAVEPSGRPNDHHHDLIGAGSRSTTPASLGSRKSPTNDQGVQAGGSGKRDDKRMKPIQPPGGGQRQQRRNTSDEALRTSQGDGGHQNHHQDYHQRNQNRGPPQNRNMQMGGPHHQQHHQGGGPHQPHHHQQQQQQQHQQQQRQQPGQGGWINRGPQMRQRGRPRPNYNNKPNGGQHTPGQKTKLKFENDYDFEQANTEFEELRNQLSKVKIDGEVAAAAPATVDGVATDAAATAADATAAAATPQLNKALIEVVNGDVDKKDDSGNETGAGETEQEEEHEVFYDKSKSFFDKISCEAVERAKGKSQRTDWRTERKLNSETFGVAATRRGNFRGRGGYRGGMGYRGGFRGGYRPQQRRDQQGGGRPGQQHQHQNNDQQQRSNMQPTAVPLPVATGS